jgi:hypothetical protein
MSYFSDLNFSIMAYSHFAAPFIMPRIHPSEDDIAMGAVDYLEENPFMKSTASPDVVTASPYVNSTMIQKITESIRDTLPRVVEHVVSKATPEGISRVVPHVVEQGSFVGQHEDVVPTVPGDILVDFTPITPPQELNLALIFIKHI